MNSSVMNASATVAAPLTSPLLLAARQWLAREAPGLPDSLCAAIESLYLAVEAGHVCIQVDGRESVSWLQSGWVGEPGTYCPFILEQGRSASRFYLARYQQYETGVAASLRQCAEKQLQPADAAALRRDLDALFGNQADDRQRLAALLAQFRALTLVSGGPGTGKTTTVVKMLALLQSQALYNCHSRESGNPSEMSVGTTQDSCFRGNDGEVRGDGDIKSDSESKNAETAVGALRILLAAPTGKAAQRLSESIRAAKQKLGVSADVIAAIPESAQTLHRLLGAQGDTGRFRHDENNPLACDLLLIDEASMIDLGLMQAVLAALPGNARLVLLGDRDQLASVEAGSVFGDLCSGGGMSSALAAQLSSYGVQLTTEVAEPAAGVLADCRVELLHSYRFASGSGIAALAQASRAGKATEFLQTLTQGSDVSTVAVTALRESVQAGYAGFRAAAKAGDVTAAFAAFLQFRVLCAHRQGAAGVQGLNALMEAGQPQWYAGRPVIVRANYYALRLFNGDIGICLPTPEGLRVFFETAPGEFRALAPGRLPAHEPAWAMTVHQAQGSEFDEVLLVLPEVVSAVLDRPLIYTAVTRAKLRFALCGDQAVLTAALATLPQRESGLVEKLQA
ncbi:MAG: exodeoxyribonuclease V subunit alpha [Moraxellaceae bacterium]